MKGLRTVNFKNYHVEFWTITGPFWQKIMFWSEPLSFSSGCMFGAAVLLEQINSSP